MDKQILFTLLACLAFSVSFAQLTIGPGDTVTYNGTLNTDLDVGEEHGYIVNTSNVTDTVIWYATTVTKPNDWEVSLCDTNNCYFLYSPATFDRYEFIAAPNIHYPLKFGASPYCVTGTATYNVHFWLKGDSAASASTVTFIANYTGACLTGINNTSADNINVYPTAFTNSITIAGADVQSFGNVKIMDVSGKLVFEKQVTESGNQLTITPAIQNAGIYYLTLEDATGKRIYSKHIAKQ